MKMIKKHILIGLVFGFGFFGLLVIGTHGQTASAGQFVLEKAVVAGGGAEKQSPTTAETGTTGQAVAGHRSTGEQFSLRSGFWVPDFELAPSAAPVSISGRVTTAQGKGIANALVKLATADGKEWTTTTSGSGHFKFADVEVGTCWLTVTSKKFTFPEPVMLVSAEADVSDVNFVADPPKPRGRDH